VRSVAALACMPSAPAPSAHTISARDSMDWPTACCSEGFKRPTLAKASSGGSVQGDCGRLGTGGAEDTLPGPEGGATVGRCTRAHACAHTIIVHDAPPALVAPARHLQLHALFLLTHPVVHAQACVCRCTAR